MKRRDFARGALISLAAPAGAAIAGVMPSAAFRGDRTAVDLAWTRASSGSIPLMGRSHALLVLQDGAVTYEAYDAEHGRDVRHISWSMAKSITHALVGIGVRQGRVNIDRPLSLVQHPDPGLTLRRLLTLTDGLDWREGTYSPEDSDAARMLYGAGRLDGAAYTAALPQVWAPGTRFNYSTGSFQLAAAELAFHLFPGLTSAAQKRQAMADWMQRELFGPLGMSTALAEFDAAGTFIGGSLVYASARDFARFGELYRADGLVEGRRILPEGWVAFARTPTVSPLYGAGFWLETTSLEPKPSLLRGRGPLDAFSAQGHAGQVILIIPSRRAVIVRLGHSPDGPPTWQALGEWLADVAGALAA